jgi:Zn-finger nucleic acid-binding protein
VQAGTEISVGGHRYVVLSEIEIGFLERDGRAATLRECREAAKWAYESPENHHRPRDDVRRLAELRKELKKEKRDRTSPTVVHSRICPSCGWTFEVSGRASARRMYCPECSPVVADVGNKEKLRRWRESTKRAQDRASTSRKGQISDPAGGSCAHLVMKWRRVGTATTHSDRGGDNGSGNGEDRGFRPLLEYLLNQGR